MLTPEVWDKVTEAVGTLRSYVFGDARVDSDAVRAEGVRYLTRLVAGGVLHSMEQGDAEYPRLVQPLTSKLQWGLPAVDAYYLVAPVHGDYTYRIWGDRGSAHIFDVEGWNGGMSGLGSFTFESRCLDYTVGSDRQVEFVLSREEQPGNWLKLPKGTGTVIVRQYFYDSDVEEPGLIHIEREGAVYPPPPLTAADIERKVERFCHFLTENPAVCAKAVESYYAPDPSTIEFAPISFGFAELQFGRGNYRCEPDEAVIIETPDPKCFYWNYQLVNHFWEALDWNIRQTSINGHEAVLDDDGMFRAVIAHTEPGVPNWLDTAGRTSGLIAGRYYQPGPITAPTVRVVPLAEVREHLPGSTPTVSPAERQERLRRRFLAARRTWRE